MHVSVAKRPPQSLFVQVDKLRKVTSSWRKQYNDSSLMRIEVRRLYHRRYIYICSSRHSCDGPDHRHRIDKYLDTLLADQTARKASPPIIPKVAIARWGTARVIISLIPPNQSQRSRSSAIASDVSSAVRRIAKCDMRNPRPSCDYHHSPGLFMGGALWPGQITTE